MALIGKSVAIVHPAWHSCGSHQVFVSQARAYAALGANVLSIAVHDTPAGPDSRGKHEYFAKSNDLVADHRTWLAMPAPSITDRRFMRALFRRLRGDPATLRLAVAERAASSLRLDESSPIDLVHCNHFFNMPLARLIASVSGAPIILETHDVQARQYDLANKSGWTIPPTVSLDELLAIEYAAMSDAALLVHLNNDESASFRAALPSASHALLYPAVTSVASGRGSNLLIVAAANQPNFMSVCWFLEKIVPFAPHLPYRIVGSIGQEIKRRAPKLFAEHSAIFTDRVDDIDASYRDAAAILLPTVAGHGISIKTIEALSSGTPLVATPHAFRGMDIDPTTLSNVRLEDEADRFAAAIVAIASGASPRQNPMLSDTRRLYEQMFSIECYQHKLHALASPLLDKPTADQSSAP